MKRTHPQGKDVTAHLKGVLPDYTSVLNIEAPLFMLKDAGEAFSFHAQRMRTCDESNVGCAQASAPAQDSLVGV